MCNKPRNISNPNFGKRGQEMKRILIPCGSCHSCNLNKAKDWFIRLKYEEKEALSAYFVTLTYNNEPRTTNGYCTAVKNDLQDYFKRLRKRESQRIINPKTGRLKTYYNTAIKYYAASEYGEKFHRPHYHAIVFNVNDINNLALAWSIKDQPLGIFSISPVTDERINYVAGYVGKKIGIPWRDNDDRLEEFSLQSKNLGIQYLKYVGDHHVKKKPDSPS